MMRFFTKLFSRINTVNSANNLSGITYNYLNLPNSVTAGSTAISYTYDATGNKLRKQVPSANINNEYISGIQYEGGVLKYVGTSEGRVVRNSATNYSYEYTLTDHLNNGRVYFDINAGAARAIQVTDYYAFGLDIQRSLAGTENKYQYNGKEKQDQEKLCDYGFRFYDPVVGRLSTIDPLAENHFDTNPYHYVLNNPMRYMDYLGLDTTYNQNNMTGKDWHNYKSGSDDINLNNVTIVGQRPGGNWGGFSGGFGNSGSWGNGFGGGAFGFGGFGSVAIPPPVLTSSSSGPFNQLDNRGGEEGSYMSKALAASAVLLTDDLTGVGAVDDVAIPVILAAAAVRDLTQKKYITYTLTNDKGKIYVGRSSGYGDPYRIMMNRYSGHDMRKFGYGNPQLDRVAQGWPVGLDAIRGREQQMIDYYGGVGSPNVGNSIRGVGYYRPDGKYFHLMSDTLFGPLANYTGFF
ncbi:RHS repeat domain-containing protein [Pedobacter sp. HMWF019]|uniref:RHS repeat domain-containing protein n=1 Tax=Pedobacter sp. HMWF019 TaxID=2056856 RepID=UPI0011B23DBC|nr:RHS repeat-associated core domain-containing protein [Pedobacter sp. HMWF019]